MPKSRACSRQRSGMNFSISSRVFIAGWMSQSTSFTLLALVRSASRVISFMLHLQWRIGCQGVFARGAGGKLFRKVRWPVGNVNAVIVRIVAGEEEHLVAAKMRNGTRSLRRIRWAIEWLQRQADLCAHQERRHLLHPWQPDANNAPILRHAPQQAW